ncbi:MAG: 30S ribosomal protein S9 [SAR324 cluster bacterium]|nr:30S ribosomal protein S9 [SAR324 cluster bacterium]MCH8887500.1 30S ribosomal protein S9 [SAR324 cluster bacterium]
MKAPEQYYGTGKRKTSIARVYVRPGNGQILVNKKSLDDYFGQEAHRVLVRQPLVLTENSERFNIKVNVRGGGTSGQAGAIRHGISRALSLLPQENIRAILKKAGLLTRDAREVERKKYGQPGARKRFQYSKR